MRRPVRSHVIRRKMFNGGMGMTKPGASIASGILASSQPLVDTIAQNAINPGRTMSMNQGGTARFNNGGANYFPGQKVQDTVANLGIAGLQRLSNVYSRLPSRDYLASYLPPALGGSPFEPQFDTIAPGGDGFRVVKGSEGLDPTVVQGATIDSTSFGDRIGVSRDFDWEVTDTSTGTVTIKDFTFNDMNGNEITAKNWFNETNSLTADRIFPLSEMFYSDTKGQRLGIETSPQAQQQAGVAGMKELRPQDEQLITSISNDIIANNPEIGIRDLVEQVAVGLKDQKEGQSPGIINIKREGAARILAEPGEKTLAEILREQKVDTDDIMSQIEDAPKKENFPHELVKMAMDKKIESLIPQWRAENYSSEFIEKLQNQGVDKKILSTLMNRRQDLIANQDKSALDLAKMIQGDTEDDTLNMEELIEKNDMTKDDGEIVTEVGDDTETEDALQVNVPIPIPQKDDSGSPTTEVDSRVLDMNAIDPPAEFDPAIEAVKEAANTNNETQTATTLEEFRQEFIDAMPEYQGMTNDEKAFAWIKMGMSIAAGQSPNAITNISKGVLASLDEFADDPAQKRKYDMQVALSAGKYAVESVNALRTQDRALESQFENYVVKEDGTITFPDGTETKVTKGQVVPISTADKIAGMNFDNLITTGMYGDELAAIKALKALEKDINTALRAELVVDDDMTRKVTTEFSEALDKVIMGKELTSFIDSAMELNAQNQVTGIKSLFKDAVLKAFNAAGVPTEVIGMSEADAEKALGGRTKYNDMMQVVANNMLKTLLGEGSKNVSNIDRELAAEISGLVRSLQAGAFQNPQLLNDKLQRVRSRIEMNISQGEATINQLSRQYENRLVAGTDEKFTSFVLDPLRRDATATKGTTYRDIGTDVGVLGEFIVNEDGNFTYKMFEAEKK